MASLPGFCSNHAAGICSATVFLIHTCRKGYCAATVFLIAACLPFVLPGCSVPLQAWTFYHWWRAIWQFCMPYKILYITTHLHAHTYTCVSSISYLWEDSSIPVVGSNLLNFSSLYTPFCSYYAKPYLDSLPFDFLPDNRQEDAHIPLPMPADADFVLLLLFHHPVCSLPFQGAGGVAVSGVMP